METTFQHSVNPLQPWIQNGRMKNPSTPTYKSLFLAICFPKCVVLEALKLEALKLEPRSGQTSVGPYLGFSLFAT